jgi:hypothetical protein
MYSSNHISFRYYTAKDGPEQMNWLFGESNIWVRLRASLPDQEVGFLSLGFIGKMCQWPNSQVGFH